MKKDNCCKDLGNWFFQYLSQDNKKVYECDVCEKVFKEDEPSWYDEQTEEHACDKCVEEEK